MKYIKCFKNITEIGNGVVVDTPNVIYLKDSNLLYIPKTNKAIMVVSNDDGSIDFIETDNTTSTTTKFVETPVQSSTDNEDENQSSGDTGQTDPATEPPTPTTSENPDGGDDNNTESDENTDVIDVENPEPTL